MVLLPKDMTEWIEDVASEIEENTRPLLGRGMNRRTAFVVVQSDDERVKPARICDGVRVKYHRGCASARWHPDDV